MSRGLGKWQRLIMEALEGIDWLFLIDLLPKEPTWAEHSALLRAADTLARKGAITLNYTSRLVGRRWQTSGENSFGKTVGRPGVEIPTRYFWKLYTVGYGYEKDENGEVKRDEKGHMIYNYGEYWAEIGAYVPQDVFIKCRECWKQGGHDSFYKILDVLKANNTRCRIDVLRLPVDALPEYVSVEPSSLSGDFNT